MGHQLEWAETLRLLSSYPQSLSIEPSELLFVLLTWQESFFGFVYFVFYYFDFIVSASKFFRRFYSFYLWNKEFLWYSAPYFLYFNAFDLSTFIIFETSLEVRGEIKKPFVRGSKLQILVMTWKDDEVVRFGNQTRVKVVWWWGEKMNGCPGTHWFLPWWCMHFQH